MDYTINKLFPNFSLPFVPVDFNEIVGKNLVLLCRTDETKDYFGKTVSLYKGLELIGYCEDEDINNKRDDIFVKGICVSNNTGHFTHVKWCILFDENGVQYVSDIIG